MLQRRRDPASSQSLNVLNSARESDVDESDPYVRKKEMKEKEGGTELDAKNNLYNGLRNEGTVKVRGAVTFSEAVRASSCSPSVLS